MSDRFGAIAFTDGVRAAQRERGSAAAYAALPDAGPDRLGPAVLGPAEAGFIAARDTLFLASVGETGWPYVQHRGGPPEFLRVLDDRTLGFLDMRGNRQYVTVGNLAGNDRVSLLLIDFARRRRLKLLGRARAVDLDADPALAARLAVPGWRARPERGIVIGVEAFDWNCPAHIAPRFTAEEVAEASAPLRRRVAALERALADAGLPDPGLPHPGHAAARAAP